MALVLDGDNGIVGVLATNADGDVIIDTNTFFVDAVTNRVGIGSITPENTLHVVSDDDQQMLVQNSATGDASIKFNRSGQTFFIGIESSDNSFRISDGGVGLGTDDRLVIDPSGNVCVGTQTATEMLTVADNIAATNMIASSAFRIGDNSHWKIRGNNAYTDLTFEYSTSSGLSDANIKITMTPSGDLVVGRNLQVNGDFITIPSSVTDPSGAVEGSMYFNTNSGTLKIYNGTSWNLISVDTVFDIFGDGSIEAFYEFNNNLNDTGGVHNMNISDFQTTDGSAYVTGKRGMAWRVGFEDWLQYQGIGLGNASSFSLWCKDLNSEGSNSVLFGVGCWNTNVINDPGYGIFVDSSNNCYPYNKPANTYDWGPRFTVPDWTHIAMTSGAGVIKTYVNGSLIDTLNTTTASSNNLLMSGRRLDHHSEDMAVTLDNIRIYNRVLTDSEVTQIYNLEN